MSVLYTEENRRYMLDCSAAIWSTASVHDDYHSCDKLGSFLCDVDFVIEDEKRIYLIEYKNACIVNAARPSAFNPASDNKLQNVSKKYFDSLHYLSLLEKNKPKQFIYILEYPNGNSTSRLLLRNRLTEYLPFSLQRKLAANGRRLIEDVRVLNIEEWNSDSVFRNYPLLPVQPVVT